MKKRRTVPFWHSIQIKFAISYMLIITAVLAVLNTYPIYASQDLVFKAKQNSLQSQVSVMTSSLAPLEELTEGGVQQVMAVLEDNGLGRILVTDLNGRILYDSEQETDEVRYALLQEIVYALGGRDVFHSSYHDGAFRSTAAAPVMYRNAVIGAVYAYDFDSEQGELLTGLQQNLVRISVVIIVLAMLLSMFLSRTMTRRISSMLAAIRNLREGSYTQQIAVSGHDELANVTMEFNALAARLQETDEVRRRFVSDASHELKTPLASVKLLTDSIEQNQNMDMDTVREFVADIGTEADRLVRITEKLLALTRMDSGAMAPPERVDVTKVTGQVLHMLRPLAEERSITIREELAEDCFIMASADDLYQIIFNLVENAVKYNREQGSITVRVQRIPGNVVITVSDTGIGIPPGDQKKIFDRFYRVDKARSRAAGGTGLGLSIVKDMVRSHGGSITLHSTLGEGTEFRVSFRAAEEVRP